MNWYYAIEGRSTGPVTESSLKRLTREGVINGGTLVWHPGLEEWGPLEKLQPEIAGGSNKGAEAPQTGIQNNSGVLKRLFGLGKKS